MSQPWIPSGERSGLQTPIAVTEKRLVLHADEKLTAFLELESAVRSSTTTARQLLDIASNCERRRSVIVSVALRNNA